jgi:hypothetical protein
MTIVKKLNSLEINNEMRQLDVKNRGFYDELTDDEKKKFSNYLMLRWGSAVQGPRELQEYYVISTNQNFNKHFFDINKHPKLQWLLATCISPAMGTHKHEWISFRGKASKNKRANLLAKIYPEAKMQDLETLANTLPDSEVKQLLVDLGWRDKEIKEVLK